MIEHEHFLERIPSATELAASTLKYTKAKERHFVERRKSIPFPVEMAAGKTPNTPKVDKRREIFRGYCEIKRGNLGDDGFDPEKKRDRDAEVSKAEKESPSRPKGLHAQAPRSAGRADCTQLAPYPAEKAVQGPPEASAGKPDPPPGARPPTSGAGSGEKEGLPEGEELESH
jgi:hypothetical protein